MTTCLKWCPCLFPNADAYLNTFEPLLFEEARESLLGDWA